MAVTKRNTQYLSKLNSLSLEFSGCGWKFTRIILGGGWGEGVSSKFQNFCSPSRQFPKILC